MDNEVLEVLKEIRDETKATNSRLDQTNSRLDQTNSRLETVESRLRFVEKRLTNGFAELTQKIEQVAKKQLAAEMHVATELTAVATVVRNAITQRRGFDKTVRDHEKRISALEKRRRQRTE